MNTIQELITDTKSIAIVFKQVLQPCEGAEVPIFPPTYPANKDSGKHRSDTPYTVNHQKNDVRFYFCDIDSVQSQANRNEAVFSSTLADLVPNHVVKAGTKMVPVNELPHRIADAAIRATDLEEEIRQAFLEYAKGNPIPLAKLSPTSLVYGAWDSRDTQIKIPRAIRSEIRATDVAVLTRSAQFSGSFAQNDLGMTVEDWKKAADVGLAPTPSVDKHGGIIVHGKIVHTASIHLGALRKYAQDGDNLLSCYLLGLAMAGVIEASKDYNLRSGCWLVPIPSNDQNWEKVGTNGTRVVLPMDEKALLAELKEIASAWSKKAAVKLGGEPVLHEVNDGKIKKLVTPPATKKTPAQSAKSIQRTE